MPSWNRLRHDRHGGKDTHPRLEIDSRVRDGETKQEEGDSMAQDPTSPTTPTNPRRNRTARDSVVSLSAVNDISRPNGQHQLPIPSLELPRESSDEPALRHHRFSFMRLRHASDSQLSKTAKEHAEMKPSAPAPNIVTTAPTSDNLDAHKRRSAYLQPGKKRTLNGKKSKSSLTVNLVDGNASTPRVTFEESSKTSTTQSVPTVPPPAYGDESSSALALPISRMSESSRSDGSFGDHGLYATTTTTHTVSTTTTFFRLPRRKRDKGPLFPLPPKVTSPGLSASSTPRLSTSGRNSESPGRSHSAYPSETSSAHGSPKRSRQHSPTHSGLFSSSSFHRSDSRASARSRASSVKGRPSTLGERGRSSTLSSLRNAIEDTDIPVPPLPQSTRTSTSTAGRPSLAGLFSIGRMRQPSEHLTRGLASATPETSGLADPKKNSVHLPREPDVPQRQEGDTPARYLARLEEVLHRSALVSVLSKSDDEFTKNVRRSYMRRFKFYEDPLDMAVRKMLMHVELPKETQQIDRTMQSFADRYHECNPGIFPSSDDAYFVAFSVIILHTDVFNKNNKNKMQKSDYVKNAKPQSGTTAEVLECFYDNIAYTQFIHMDDDMEVTAESMYAQKSTKKGSLKSSSTSSLRRNQSGQIDPYIFLIDGKLENLRPDVDDVLPMQDSFDYLSKGAFMDVKKLNRTFYRTGVIQIVSSRSRPGAFANQATMLNPAEAQAGVVDIKVTKVGVIWRKDPKKKKTRSPWQEWGAILTGSQLYFFRNTSWCKNLIHQYEHHLKHGRAGSPVTFQPPLEQFKPDFILSIDDAVALVDSQYKKHKNAFVFTRQNNFAEVFLADNESELKDWLAKINYAATYRTSGVRMKGVIGNSYESYKHRETQRPSSAISEQPESDLEGHDKDSTRNDEEFSSQVMEARRQIMSQRILQANEKILALDQQLEGLMRAGRQLKILAPIQARTRSEVREAAVRLATHTRVVQMERWRVRCHRDILKMDLEDDQKLLWSSTRTDTDGSQKDELDQQGTKDPHQNRSPFGRLSSKHGDSKRSPSRTRPSSQKLLSMDDIFRSPSRNKPSNHQPKGSWELPPLNFDRKGSDADRSDTTRHEDQTAGSSDEDANFLTVPNTPMGHTRNSSEIDVSSQHTHEDDREREVLVEAGVLPDPEQADEPELEDTSPEDKSKQDAEEKERLSRVRHSLQRKLGNTNVPSHSRSRKGKESSSSAGVGGEDGSNPSVDHGQLTRSKGSFTVHGKKASVVTFGSEWQNMTPEERMKRARPQSGSVRLPSTNDTDSLLQNEILREGRIPSISAASSDALTIKSAMSEIPDEGK